MENLDHIVIAGPDLGELIDWFEELTGVRAIPGGRHDHGTENALVPLAEPKGAYVELIAAAEKPVEQNFFDVNGVKEPTPAAWAIHPDDLDAYAKEHGKGVVDMQRTAPDGRVLKWRLITPEVAPISTDPFAIDWGETPHPSQSGEASLRLESLEIKDDRIAVTFEGCATIGA